MTVDGHEQTTLPLDDPGNDDQVVQLASGQLKLLSELTDAELAAGFKVRRDLTVLDHEDEDLDSGPGEPVPPF
jgi:hypothetical protein